MALGDSIELHELEKEFADNPTITGGRSIISSMILPRLYKWSFMILMTFILINIFVGKCNYCVHGLYLYLAVVTAAYEEVTAEAEEENQRLEYRKQDFLMRLLYTLRLVPKHSAPLDEKNKKEE